MYKRILASMILFTLGFNTYAETIKESYAFAILGEPKYIANFTHFDYTNQAAPKGGKITLATIGTFDNFNRYASRGNSAVRTGEIYDTLFTASNDEIGSYYPLIAESARYTDNFNWMEVHINPQARFNDGSPVSAKDVEFSFNKFMTEGVPQFRSYYKGVKVRALSQFTVRIELPAPSKDMMIGLIGGLSIMPAKYWKDHKLSDPLSTPPLSGGAYKIGEYKMGQYIVYHRVKDYWAANLPVNRGRNNFDQIRYDYYLDDKVALEAFKAGAYDFRQEGAPKSWATQYKGSNFAKGYIIKQDQQNKSAQDTRWLAFNIKRPQFQDRKVRDALTLAFDFEWMNKSLYYNAYQRTRSYFQNTEYEAKGYPDAAELQWLAPLKASIPPEVFTTEYQPPKTDGSGTSRANILKAMNLLKEAGWSIKDQKLVNNKTGEPFVFEILLLSGSNYQYVLPLKHNLKRLGIQMNIREVDMSQFANRLRSRDFDMIPTVYNAYTYPESSLQIVWASSYIDSTYNRPGVTDPSIDKLLQEIVNNQGNPKQLLSLGRALDRVLTWNKFMIPMWYSNHDRFAYWNKFSMPSIRPAYALGFDTWWFDNNKAQRLPEQYH